MPVHVYPSSTCDVCQEEYYNSCADLEGDNIPRTPHSIGCGHVFCLQCLKAIRVTLCPLCRMPYDPRRLIKLHVDKYTGDGYDNLVKEETKILRATVVGFGEGASEATIDGLLTEAEQWLHEGGEARTLGAVRSEAMLTVYNALHRYKAVMHQTTHYEDIISRLDRQLTVLEGELDKAQLVEKMLLEEQELMRQQFDAERRALVSAKTELDLRIDHQSTEIRQLVTENKQLKARYSKPANNPLPPPPVPVDIDLQWLTPAPVILDNDGQPDMLGRSATRHQYNLFHPVEDMRTVKPAAQLKLPSIVPGAAAHQRVVLDEHDLNPLLVEGSRPPTQAYFNVVGVDHTSAQRTPGSSVDLERRSTRSSASREVQAPEPRRPPRSQPRPFANAAAIENLPPAPGLGLFDPTPNITSTANQSYTPVPMPVLGAPPASSASASFGGTDPHWGVQHNLHVTDSASHPGPSLPSAPSRPPVSNPYLQASILSDLDLGLVEIPTAIPAPSLTLGQSATSSLGDLGILGLRDMPSSLPSAGGPSQNASSTNLGSESSRNTSTSNLTPNRSRSFTDALRPALAGSRTSSTGSVAPRMQRRRVSFDPETQTIRRRDMDEEEDLDGLDLIVQRSTRMLQSVFLGSDRNSEESLTQTGLGLAIPNVITSGQVISGLDDLHHVNNSLLSLVDDADEHERHRHSRSYRESRSYIVDRSPDLSPIVGVSSATLSRTEDRRPSTSTSSGRIFRDARSSSRTNQPEMAHGSVPIPIVSSRPMDARPTSRIIHNHDRDSDSTPVASGSGGSRRRSRRESMPTVADRSYDSLHGPSSNSALLLHLVPLGPGTSEATTADGQPSSIHAPRPSRGSNDFGSWFSRTSH